MKLFIYFIMVFFHIYDDFYHQSKSFLVTGKQKSWWERNCPDIMYENDYLIVLFLHAFSWSFMVHIPLIIYKLVIIENLVFEPFCSSIFIHSMIHAFVDDLKANKLRINLIVDQLLHLLQMIIMCYTFFKLF